METLDTEQTIWARISDACNDKNGVRSLRRIVANANMLTNLMEAHDILTEANNTLYTLKTMNKKLTMGTHNRTVDNVLVYVFLKALTTVPTRTTAYSLGLIDKDGRLIRQPKTKEENDSISNLDLLMFKMRKWLASRLQYLSTVSWIKGIGNNIRLQNYFSNVDTAARQYVVQRLNADLERLLAKD